MNQDNNQQSQQMGSVPEWFAPPVPTPNSPRPKRSRKPLIIIGVVIVLLGITVAVIVMLSRQGSTCLSAADYKALTGVELSSDTTISPIDSFYDNYILFKDGATTYDDNTDGGQYGNALIQKISDFYKAHPTKPMIITVSASYSTTEADTLTNQRIATVHSSFLKAGIPESAVILQGANYVEPEDAVEGNADSGEVSISITSDSTCRQ